MLKQTISIFLAVQLLFSFWLCGGLCCVKPVELSAPQKLSQSAEPKEDLPPCHRKKTAEKVAARQDHQTHRTASTGQKTADKIATSVLNRDCCAVKREAPEGESPLSIFASQNNKLATTFEALPLSGGQAVFRLPQVPIQISATHSPPHTGFQLSLRI